MKKCCLLLCALAALPLFGTEAKPRSKVVMSPSFRQVGVAETGPVVLFVDEPDEKVRVRAEYRYWLDLPERHTQDEAQIRQFVAGLVAETNLVAATADHDFPAADEPVRTLPDALRYRRDLCWEKCRELAAPYGGMLEGDVDFADDRYVGYTLVENCYYGGNNGGEYVTTHGVYSIPLKRRLRLSDLFAPEALPRLNRLVRDAYANHSARGEYCATYEDFRMKYPKEGDPEDGELSDPVATDGFTILRSGLRWSFEDRSIVGYAKMRAEQPLHADVCWRDLLPLLRDRSLLPAVTSAFGL